MKFQHLRGLLEASPDDAHMADLRAKADAIYQEVAGMSMKAMRSWYKQHVGYDPVDEDPHTTAKHLRQLVAGSKFFTAAGPEGVDTPGAEAVERELEKRFGEVTESRRNLRPGKVLTEATRVPAGMLNVSKLGMDDLLDMYQNSGYTLDKGERETFKKARYQATNKSGPHHHAYIVLCEDPSGDDDERYYVTRLFVFLSDDGLLHAEPQGMPDFSSASLKDATRYFDEGK